MEKSAEMVRLNSQINARQSSMNSLYQQNNMHQKEYDSAAVMVGKLEKELEDLLGCQRDMVMERNNIEMLVQGDGSPMGRIQFVKSGVLEGRAMQTMQERVTEMRSEQQKTLLHIKDTIQVMDRKAIEIEQEIEEQRATMMKLEGIMEGNRHRIASLRVEINSARNSLRSLA